MSKKAMFRGQIDEDLDRIVRLLAGLKRQSLSDVLTEALNNWVELPQNQEYVEKHNLREK